MFGAIGAIIFGVVFAGSWMIADDREQAARENAKKVGSKLYYDKNGKLRNAQTNKKATDVEIHDYFFGGYEKRREEQKDKTDLKYWGYKKFTTAEIKTIYGTMETILSYSSSPVLEIYDNYDAFKSEYDELKKYYIEKGVSILDISNNCTGINKNNKFSKNNIKAEKIGGCEVHYNF